MRLPFKGEYRLSQKWGLNEHIYKRFGLKGHNGVDWALPTGTKIIAPHSGKILEKGYDKNGYGRYIKIENDKWGSILAHLKRIDVNIGDEVSEGGHLALSNNTGFSTGPHLHWGLYPKPRNRGNGYSGTVDPFKGGIMSSSDDIGIPKKTFENLVSKSSKYDEFNKIGYGSAAEVTHDLQGLRKSIDDKNRAIKAEEDRAKGFRKNYKDLLAEVADKLRCQQEEHQITVALEKMETQLDRLSDLERNYASLQLSSGKEKEELNAEIERLKALLKNPDTLDKYKFEELLANIIKRLTRVLKRSR